MSRILSCMAKFHFQSRGRNFLSCKTQFLSDYRGDFFVFFRFLKRNIGLKDLFLKNHVSGLEVSDKTGPTSLKALKHDKGIVFRQSIVHEFWPRKCIIFLPWERLRSITVYRVRERGYLQPLHKLRHKFCRRRPKRKEEANAFVIVSRIYSGMCSPTLSPVQRYPLVTK